ncbi:MAG: GH92 family glycosyl hydrolase [Bacteroidales bacterium]
MKLSNLLLMTAIVTVAFLSSCDSKGSQNSSSASDAEADYTQYVDPFIGSDYHGHVFVGANVPNGAVQVGPTNYIKGWDWCSGYHYSDSVMTGFSQLHLSGTGIGDLGDVLIMPYTGALNTKFGSPKDMEGTYTSKYSHDDETAQAGYYQVRLKTYDINVELSATKRVAIHKYTFPKADEAHIAINLTKGIGWDKVSDSQLKKIDDNTYVGYRKSKGWANDQWMYFAIKSKKAIQSLKIEQEGELKDVSEATGKDINGFLTFATEANEEVMLKVGISPVSIDNALANIDSELPDWNFNKVVADAKTAWNKELSRIAIKSDDKAKLRKFYTAMFHAFHAPFYFNDANGDYRGTDKKEYKNQDFDNYTVFSLWDTYRAEHPLYTLLDHKRVQDFGATMMAIFEQQGRLPVWHLMGNETDCMVGYPGITVLADMYLKGIYTDKPEAIYNALKTTANFDDGNGSGWILKTKYLPSDKVNESVSKGEEYAVADWAVAQVAKELGHEQDYKEFSERAKYYQLYYDPKVGFMRGKLENGEWQDWFHPVYNEHRKGYYTEGNAWQYLWMAPQDVEGLVELMGGKEIFATRLDSLFSISSEMNEEASNDISGMIGQYAHGNEPGHHTIYMYNYVGQPWKTAEKARYIMNTLYTDKPDGLCGNEDCGQMSAWYILSSMGIYSVNPANSAFVLGSPLHDEVTINGAEGNSFTIKAINNSDKNIYIQSATLDGKPYTPTYITYKQIMDGGMLELTMGDTPSKTWGTEPKDFPTSSLKK